MFGFEFYDNWAITSVKMSSSFAFQQDFDSDDDEQPQKYSGRDATVFVIDASSSMFTEFEEDGTQTCLFKKCLRVLERLLLNKIISNNKDLVRKLRDIQP